MANESRDGERIAKVIARAGLASRRDAEGMVADLRVTVNGRTVSNVAHNVVPGDRVAVDGQPLPEPEAARVWLYHKPAGLVTTARDEKGRETVFDALPEEMGRVLSVGRLDLTSEGLLLLTNDGALKRQLELPATGWLRRYRVRVNGTPDEAALERLRTGIEVEGETFAPMQVTLDRQKGANAWLTIGLREGKNREIRRAMDAVGLYVNRLIRVSYGPFQLGSLEPGEVEEVKPRVLRDQLGGTYEGELAEGRKETAMADEKGGPKGGAKGGRPSGPGGRKPRPSGDRLVEHGRGKPREGGPKGNAQGKPRGPGNARAEDAARPDRPRTGKPPVTRNDGDGSRPARPARPDGKPAHAKGGPRRSDDAGRPARPGGKPFAARDGDRKPRDGDAKPRFAKDGDRKPRDGDGKPRFAKDGDRKPRDGDSKPHFAKDGGRKPRREDDRGPRRDDKAGGPKRDAAPDRPKETKAERTARMRADTSVSIRKGGQKGRGISKPAKPASTKRMRKPGDDDPKG
ncbi:Ribosomal large subunit pseudouridine synthase B [Jannaschia seosinensis]|uniref:Pseudouridine synthase n=1 Tax=Jannaschia seosinensis TaxID=313367 RepID=A0A0M7BDQ5_9RHOB|nr:pseudouridine synthase [Jannaschia seosinensis]CUH40319.1 Ribosomal large subunit pseudouridine synthase B [Jannaschia seosinensis]